jgi:hypothetical protein
MNRHSPGGGRDPVPDSTSAPSTARKGRGTGTKGVLSTDSSKRRSAIYLHLMLVEKNPPLAEVLTVELRQSAKFMKEYRNSKFGEFLKLLATPIEEGQRDGTIRPDLDPHVIARALFGALDELALSWLLRHLPQYASTHTAHGHQLRGQTKKGGEELDLARVAEQLGDLFVEGLRLKPPPKVTDPPTAARGGGQRSPSTTARRPS